MCSHANHKLTVHWTTLSPSFQELWQSASQNEFRRYINTVLGVYHRHRGSIYYTRIREAVPEYNSFLGRIKTAPEWWPLTLDNNKNLTSPIIAFGTY